MKVHTDRLLLNRPVHCQTSSSSGKIPIRGVLHVGMKVNVPDPFDVDEVVAERVLANSRRATVLWHLSLIGLWWTRARPCHKMDGGGLISWKMPQPEDELESVRPWTLSE